MRRPPRLRVGRRKPRRNERLAATLKTAVQQFLHCGNQCDPWAFCRLSAARKLSTFLIALFDESARTLAALCQRWCQTLPNKGPPAFTDARAQGIPLDFGSAMRG